jgi:hypothetical protein
MNRVIPRYVPADTIEDKFGFLVTAKKPEGGERVYLSRGESWSDIGDARFYTEALHAADSIKDVKARAADGYSEVDPETIQLVRAIGMLVPTTISEYELKKQRRAEALSKLSEDEIAALGLDAVDWEAVDKKAKAARR